MFHLLLNIKALMNSFKMVKHLLVKKRTRKDHHNLKNMTLRCDRSGSYENSLGLTERTRKRHKGTRLIDCPFELYAAKRNNL
jgi:hypothetical protein